MNKLLSLAAIGGMLYFILPRVAGAGETGLPGITTDTGDKDITDYSDLMTIDIEDGVIVNDDTTPLTGIWKDAFDHQWILN